MTETEAGKKAAAGAKGGAGDTLCIISCLPLSISEPDDDDEFVPSNV